MLLRDNGIVPVNRRLECELNKNSVSERLFYFPKLTNTVEECEAIAKKIINKGWNPDLFIIGIKYLADKMSDKKGFSKIEIRGKKVFLVNSIGTRLKIQEYRDFVSLDF